MARSTFAGTHLQVDLRSCGQEEMAQYAHSDDAQRGHAEAVTAAFLSSQKEVTEKLHY
eukprot:COSAG02_NODE_880_length_16242_cov_5.512946_12_plen_58_part_00